jgi:glycolate oxidase
MVIEPTSSHTEATEALLAQLGASKVFLDRETRLAHAHDNTRIAFLPEAVVKPADEDDIAVVLKLANARKVPVYVRGAGTGTTGASAPVKGGWVVTMTHWQNIEIDADAGMARVQPGAITAKINEEAAKHGLFFPPDPSSIKHCTIGGNIATNAGGLRAAKYGVVRDYVYALEGLLPTGEKVKWAGPVRKYVSGYNLRDLWIGSEGTLGIITGAVLKLIPLPKARHTFLLAFDTDETALEACVALLRRRIVPSVCEFLDTQTVECAEARAGKPVFSSAELGENAPATPAVMLIELDGHPTQIADDAEAVRHWAAANARAVRETADPVEAEKLWNLRRTCSQAMFSKGNAKLNEDVVVPLAAYLSLIRMTREVKAATGLATPTFGHAADGNFHVHIMYDRDNPEQCAKAEEAIMMVMKKVVELGGAITGEHGIGLAKSPFLRLQHNEAEIRAMLAIKHALDPNNILGRGQIFEVTNLWDYTPIKVTLPWDKH